MAQMKIAAAAVSIALALAASSPAVAGEANRGLESVNQPVVQRTDYVMDLGLGGAGVAESELFRLADWFDTLQLGYGDRVYVDAGYAGEQARQSVAAVAAEYGLLLSRGAPVTTGSPQSGAVRVIVSRSEATVPGCPNWEDRKDIGERISTSPNYGCATNSNLAAMVADPNDLVLGQVRDSVSDPRESSKAITYYRNRVMTGSEGGLKTEKSGGSK